MNTQMQDIAHRCFEGVETSDMSFPQIVATLQQAGFEGYSVDLRRGTIVYYLPNGESVEMVGTDATRQVAAEFDAAGLRTAIREAQMLVPGYTYRGFLSKVAHAGCAGYLVSFLGRRVLYFGRSAETHTEHFPSQP